MRHNKVIIESRWGALGALVLLQCYGLLLAYSFSGAVSHAASTSLLDIPGHILELSVGLVFLALFIYSQGILLAAVKQYLAESRDVSGWLRECTRPQSILRIIVTAAAITFYVALLSGKFTFGFPEMRFLFLLGYQVFFPVASYFVGKQLRRSNYPTETRYITIANQVFGFVLYIVASAIFYGFSILMKKENEPAYWMFQMMGLGVAVFGLIEFLLEDIKGRYREVIIEDEG